MDKNTNYPKFKMYAYTCNECAAESEHCVECSQQCEVQTQDERTETESYELDACFGSEDSISSSDKKTINFVNKYCTL